MPYSLFIQLIDTSGFTTTHVVVFLWVCIARGAWEGEDDKGSGRAARYGYGWSGFPDIEIKSFALRKFYILGANKRKNQLPLGCSTIHAIFPQIVWQI